MRTHMTVAARRELALRTAVRYKNAARPEKKRILDEFLESTGFHRKQATRLLNDILRGERPRSAGRLDRGLAHSQSCVRQTARSVFSYNENGLFTSRVEYDGVDYGVSGQRHQASNRCHVLRIPSVSPTLDDKTGNT